MATTTRRPLRPRTLLLLVLAAATASCQFLQNEFTTLNAAPPSAGADQPPPAERPW